MLADRYPDDEERGKAMGNALGGLALGVLGTHHSKLDQYHFAFFQSVHHLEDLCINSLAKHHPFSF